MSDRQIRYALQKLCRENLLVKGNFNCSAYDHTSWYALTDYGQSLLNEVTDLSDQATENVGSERQDFQIRRRELSNQSDNGVESNHKSTITSTIKSTKKGTEEGTAKSVKRCAPHRHQHGEYRNVLLTDAEVEALKERFPGDWQLRIDRLSEYIASRGAKYKSHYVTLLSWARREGEKKGSAPSEHPAQKVYAGVDVDWLLGKEGRA